MSRAANGSDGLGTEARSGCFDLEEHINQFRGSLDTVTLTDDERHRAGFARQLYAFTRKLTRCSGRRTHRLILQTLSRRLSARIGAFAVYSEAEQALVITATHGYPLEIVEHLRIAPGAGVIGETFATGRAALGRAPERALRRLRYRTDSYLAVPLVAATKPIAVIALTDRTDEEAFDDHDLAVARLLAAPAALAVARERVTESLEELTRAATVDVVTGLFNRRYFETRIHAEVQRARRQQQELALLMVDIDDFKRINDTFGHLEGDHALREVADLLRGGVRIFDVCARYGGEEFAIVMPGGSRDMAVQVAERIRRQVEDRSRLDPLPITVSVGVGILALGDSADDLIGAADRSLIAAKRAGKNVVKADG